MKEEYSNCCSRTDSPFEIVDGIGVCGGCGEWCTFEEDKEEELTIRERYKMKKLAVSLAIVLLAGCGLSKVDIEQNENMQVFVQAHNALVAQLDKVIGATDKAFSVKKTKEQEVFRAAILATPTPTIAATPEVK